MVEPTTLPVIRIERCEETATYRDFKAEIGRHFSEVVHGIDGVYSSRCGDLSIRREDGRVLLSTEAAKLINGIIQQIKEAT